MTIDPLPIIRAYPDHLRERIRRLNRLPVQEERDFVLYWMHAELAELCGRCRIDHTVAPVPHTHGGSTAGYARWEQLKRHGLPNYADTRNDAAIAFPKGARGRRQDVHPLDRRICLR